MDRNIKHYSENSKMLAEFLSARGKTHNRYKNYTSQEKAAKVIDGGCLFLSDGKGWNDVPDRTQMRNRKAFGMSFSYSTMENVAMWMLYSGNHGKAGTALDFPGSVLRDIMKTEEVEIGCFQGKSYTNQTTIYAEDYEIFLTDIVYAEYTKDDKKVRLSLEDDHITKPKEVVEDPHIFVKSYPWIYERECRLVILFDEKVLRDNPLCNYAKIQIPEKSRKKLTDNNLVRSPVYRGESRGRDSALKELVAWDF